MIEDGLLREDLYYRLRGLTIRLPALSERRDDIPHLAAHFAGSPSALTPEALDVLVRSPWPGNVRQLRNTVSVARAAAGGGPIGPNDLPLVPDEASRHRVADPAVATPGVALRELERQAISKALEDAAGNRSQAARALGIHRSTLRRKLRKLGIAGEEP